jgi:hypothetical protein
MQTLSTALILPLAFATLVTFASTGFGRTNSDSPSAEDISLDLENLRKEAHIAESRSELQYWLQRSLNPRPLVTRGGDVSGGGDILRPATEPERLWLETMQRKWLGLTQDTTTAPSVSERIVILDSGVLPGSRAEKNVTEYWDCTGDHACQRIQNRAEWQDHSLHGTLVSDLITQVNPSAELIVLRTSNSSDAVSSFSAILKALEWLKANHESKSIRIASLSGGSRELASGSWDAANKAHLLIKEMSLAESAKTPHAKQGIWFVTSAGNDRRDSMTFFPANVPEAITIGSSAHDFHKDRANHRISSFNNRGIVSIQTMTYRKTLFGHHLEKKPTGLFVGKPDLLAPGERVVACADRCYLVNGSSFAVGLFIGALSTQTETLNQPRRLFLDRQHARCSLPNLTFEMSYRNSPYRSCSADFSP